MPNAVEAGTIINKRRHDVQALRSEQKMCTVGYKKITKTPITLGGSLIIESDATLALQKLPSSSVQCIVTSPPYWGLRDYGIEGQI